MSKKIIQIEIGTKIRVFVFSRSRVILLDFHNRGFYHPGHTPVMELETLNKTLDRNNKGTP